MVCNVSSGSKKHFFGKNRIVSNNFLFYEKMIQHANMLVDMHGFTWALLIMCSYNYDLSYVTSWFSVFVWQICWFLLLVFRIWTWTDCVCMICKLIKLLLLLLLVSSGWWSYIARTFRLWPYASMHGSCALVEINHSYKFVLFNGVVLTAS